MRNDQKRRSFPRLVTVWQAKEENRAACAFDEGSECGALIGRQCFACPFFQTPEQLELSRQRSVSRLKILGLYQKYLKKYGRSIL